MKLPSDIAKQAIDYWIKDEIDKPDMIGSLKNWYGSEMDLAAADAQMRRWARFIVTYSESWMEGSEKVLSAFRALTLADIEAARRLCAGEKEGA